MAVDTKLDLIDDEKWLDKGLHMKSGDQKINNKEDNYISSLYTTVGDNLLYRYCQRKDSSVLDLLG